MLVLGIESSCDETAAAVVHEGTEILSNVVSSQVKVHEPYGGVVPELASRHHLQNITHVVRRALAVAGVELSDLDGVAVTRGPGLVGALLVGIQMAKALAYVASLPLIGINHLEGHLHSSRLGTDPPCGRHLALLVSGGHTLLVLVEGFGEYRVVGRSRDDAAGEAFDKVSKLLGLGYPGGPVIEALAADGNGDAIRFPRALPQKTELDFSFSGLKTAMAVHVRKHGVPSGRQLCDLCASFQTAVADVLVRKSMQGLRMHRVRELVAAGGVLANSAIRVSLTKHAEAEGVSIKIPPVGLCTDNAAMIAAVGTEHLIRGEKDGLDLNAAPRLPL